MLLLVLLSVLVLLLLLVLVVMVLVLVLVLLLPRCMAQCCAGGLFTMSQLTACPSVPAEGPVNATPAALESTCAGAGGQHAEGKEVSMRRERRSACGAPCRVEEN